MIAREPALFGRNKIPTHLRAAVYYFGFDPDEIVELRYLTGDACNVWVHLRNGEQEWKGNLSAPPWKIPMPTIRCEDLINGTKNCPTCHGSGKVAKHE